MQESHELCRRAQAWRRGDAQERGGVERTRGRLDARLVLLRAQLAERHVQPDLRRFVRELDRLRHAQHALAHADRLPNKKVAKQ